MDLNFNEAYELILTILHCSRRPKTNNLRAVNESAGTYNAPSFHQLCSDFALMVSRRPTEKATMRPSFQHRHQLIDALRISQARRSIAETESDALASAPTYCPPPMRVIKQ